MRIFLLFILRNREKLAGNDKKILLAVHMAAPTVKT
ncbi:uncharacterized protein METZ01_LOCUS115484 [marine metagenome]|uniref:Uncharacterized protein n=1 Tax=marine metagenome TaxID=408172 RepID=A0A381XDE0_9ZZZZ